MLSGDRLKFLRYLHDRTQAEIADWCNLSIRYVGMVEAGDMIPTEETYRNILNAIYQIGTPVPKVKKPNAVKHKKKATD